jgi:YgiT-type zinc finger domain-containing protein
MLNINTCPSCGSKKVKHVRKNWNGEFQGRTYTVPELEFYECPECAEKIYDREAMRKIEAYSPAFAKVQARQGEAAKRQRGTKKSRAA